MRRCDKRRAVQAVDALGGEGDGGVEAECQGRGLEVVVDGLGHADDAKALLVKLVGDGEAAVSADGDDGVDVVLTDATDDLVGEVHFFFGAVGLRDDATKRIAAIGGAEDGAAEVGNLADGGAMQLHESAVAEALGLEDAVVAFANADDVPAEAAGGVHGSVNDGVEAGGVSAAGVDGDFLNDVGHSGRILWV